VGVPSGLFWVGVPSSVFLLLPHKYIVLNGCWSRGWLLLGFLTLFSWIQKKVCNFFFFDGYWYAIYISYAIYFERYAEYILKGMQRNVSRKSCWMFSTARGRFVERVFPSGGKRGVFVGFSEPTRKTPSGLPSGLFWVGVPSGLFRVGVPSGLFRVGVPSGLFRVGFPSGCSEKRFPVTPTQIHCVEWLLISRLIFPVGFFEFVFPSGFFRMAFFCFSLANTFCWLLSHLSQTFNKKYFFFFRVGFCGWLFSVSPFQIHVLWEIR